MSCHPPARQVGPFRPEDGLTTGEQNSWPYTDLHVKPYAERHVKVYADSRDRIELDVASTVTGTTRHFHHVNDLERDIESARVYVGYHWRTSGEVGSRLAERVACWALRRYFRATDHSAG